MGSANTIGAEITVTSTRTLYWTVTTDVAATGTPKVALLDSYARPVAGTAWATATWSGADTANADGTHTRTLSLLVAGPSGPTTGSPVVLPTAGEYSTWVRVATSTDQVELEGQLLVCK